MKKKKINFYAIAVISLVLLESIFVYLSYKSFNNNDTYMEEVNLLEEANLDRNNMFAIMLGDKNGIYTESDSNKWPTDGSYSFNASRSGCIDANGNTLEDVLSFNASSWTATLTTNTTAYCYLYFDLDQVAPQAFTFYLGGSTNPTYTTSTSTTAYLSWTDTDITKYCLTTESSSTNCTWNSTSGKTVTVNYTLTSGDATKTVYAYLKDAAGNVSPSVTDTIILDTAAPTGNSVKINNNATYTNSTTVTLTLASTGASQMCISNTTSCSSWVTYATSKSHTIAGTAGTNTVYVWFKDAAGNQTSTYVSDDITYDGTAPTVTAKVNNNNSTSATMTITSTEAGTYCVNTSATATTSCTFTGSITANGSITTTAFTTNGTYYAHVTDAAGNIGNSSAVSVTVSQPFGQYLISAKTAGWNSTAYGGMYRYIGTDTETNNYVKIGDVLYRIIGVTSEANSTLGLAANQVKVIKEASIGAHNWHSSYTVNATWNTGGTDAAMYTYLQGSSVLGSTSVIPSGWTDKISSVKWNVGDVQTYTNGDTVYGLEDNTQTTNTSKIGLMYLSDYYYAYNAGGTQNCNSSPYCVSWMTDTSNYTWTMSRYGDYGNGSYRAWYVLSSGVVARNNLATGNAVRPVFYLSTSVNWKSGTGASGDPFIIE